ncbi:hypothetical protein SAMN06265795_10332 [Noviherbaspirillum humi]|uniref:Uncharacterized protein n=1 Tax=Noviherbaspirillum humi TaxID=1688639 RepID=A0A239EV14_9BURK|nr:hypothetical protein [Noviherbaspirillum humi]SNS48475.1 hypothetical protein SAMN06265795_10332 [Noviherbaspirillum humi]
MRHLAFMIAFTANAAFAHQLGPGTQLTALPGEAHRAGTQAQGVKAGAAKTGEAERPRFCVKTPAGKVNCAFLPYTGGH